MFLEQPTNDTSDKIREKINLSKVNNTRNFIKLSTIFKIFRSFEIPSICVYIPLNKLVDSSSPGL